jgi:hypothetical protein
LSTARAHAFQRLHNFRDLGGGETRQGADERVVCCFARPSLIAVPIETWLNCAARDDLGPRLEQLLATLRSARLAPTFAQRLRLIATTQPEYLAEIHERVLAAHGPVERSLAEASGVTRSTVQQLQQRLLSS